MFRIVFFVVIHYHSDASLIRQLRSVNNPWNLVCTIGSCPQKFLFEPLQNDHYTSK